MITVRLYQKSKLRADNKATIYYVLAYKTRRKYISTKIHVNLGEFDNSTGFIMDSVKNHRKLNLKLQDNIERIENIILDLERTGVEPTFEKVEQLFNSEGTAVDFIQWSLDELKNERGSIAYKTYVGYKDRLNQLKEYKPKIMMNEINHEFLVSLRQYFKRNGRKPNGYYQDFATIKKFHKLAVIKGFAKGNPFENFRLEKEKTVKAWLTKEDLKKLHDLLNDKVDGKLLDEDKRIKEKEKNTLNHFLFTCYCGIRFGDKVAFDESNIVDGRIVIRQNKTGNPVQIPFTTQATELLPKILERPLKVGNNRVNEDLKVCMETAKIKKKITFHCSRHTFAINCMLAGVDLMTVRDWLGHTTVTTTEIYAKIADQYKDESMKKLASFLD